MLTSYNGVNVLKFAISLSPGHLSSWRGVVCVVWPWEEPRDEALLHQWPRQLPLHRGGGDVHPSQRTRWETCRWGQRSVRVGVVTLSLLVCISLVHYLFHSCWQFLPHSSPKGIFFNMIEHDVPRDLSSSHLLLHVERCVSLIGGWPIIDSVLWKFENEFESMHVQYIGSVRNCRFYLKIADLSVPPLCMYLC